MRALLILIFVISLATIGCDGRDKIYKTKNQILKEHKLYKTFSKRITYIPEQYLEIKTDTIMSNEFNVKIKSYTDMTKNTLKDYTKSNIHYKNYYRDINTVVSISKNNRDITSTLVTKQLFIDYDESFNTLLKNKVIQGVWLNQYATIINNKVILNVQLYEPETNNRTNFVLGFDDDGNIFINEDLKQYI